MQDFRDANVNHYVFSTLNSPLLTLYLATHLWGRALSPSVPAYHLKPVAVGRDDSARRVNHLHMIDEWHAEVVVPYEYPTGVYNTK